MPKSPVITTNEEADLAPGKEKPYRISTGFGFYLHITPTGLKSWRYSYNQGKSRHTLVLGHFPEMSLETAYLYKQKCVQCLKDKIDPKTFMQLKGTSLDPVLQEKADKHDS